MMGDSATSVLGTPSSSHTPAAIPTVDLGRWFGGSPSDRVAVAAELGAACESVGFLQLVGHGLPDDVVDGLRATSDAFFALPADDKLALRPPAPGVNRGYAARRSESLAYSLGQARPPDLFEAFNVGIEVPGGDPEFFPDNIWPDLAGFRPAVEAYLATVRQLAATIEDVIELALDLPDDFFPSRTDRAVNVMRIIRYERAAGEPPPDEGQMRMGAHTDYGIFTILLADPVPGLQIVAPHGGWVDVTPDPAAVVMNIGDALAVWTNDRWRSTLHRVVPPQATGDDPALRRSWAFFHDGNIDTVVSCLPSCLAPGEQPRYAPLTIRDHLAAKVLSARTNDVPEATQTVSDRPT